MLKDVGRKVPSKYTNKEAFMQPRQGMMTYKRNGDKIGCYRHVMVDNSNHPNIFVPFYAVHLQKFTFQHYIILYLCYILHLISILTLIFPQ